MDGKSGAQWPPPRRADFAARVRGGGRRGITGFLREVARAELPHPAWVPHGGAPTMPLACARKDLYAAKNRRMGSVVDKEGQEEFCISRARAALSALFGAQASRSPLCADNAAEIR